MLYVSGIFTLRKRYLAWFVNCGLILKTLTSELRFFYQNGTSHLFPEAWYDSNNLQSFSKTYSFLPRSEYEEIIPESERDDMIKAYHTRLNSPDEKIRFEAARAWTKWEYVTLNI